MRRQLPFFAVAILVAAPAFAGSSRTVTVSGTDCRQIVHHVPGADVAYKPGVDVHGKAVASADLDSGQQWKLPETLEFPIVVNPFNVQGTSTSAAAKQFSNTDMTVGKVSVNTLTGQVLLDGKPVESGTASAIAEECRKRGAR